MKYEIKSWVPSQVCAEICTPTSCSQAHLVFSVKGLLNMKEMLPLRVGFCPNILWSKSLSDSCGDG